MRSLILPLVLLLACAPQAPMQLNTISDRVLAYGYSNGVLSLDLISNRPHKQNLACHCTGNAENIDCACDPTNGTSNRPEFDSREIESGCDRHPTYGHICGIEIAIDLQSPIVCSCSDSSEGFLAITCQCKGN